MPSQSGPSVVVRISSWHHPKSGLQAFVHSHPINKAAAVILPVTDASYSPADLVARLSAALDALGLHQYALRARPGLFADQSFLQQHVFGDGARLYAATSESPLASSDAAALLPAPAPRLALSVTQRAFERLGLTGRKLRYSAEPRYLIEIALGGRSFKPGMTYHAKVLAALQERSNPLDWHVTSALPLTGLDEYMLGGGGGVNGGSDGGNGGGAADAALGEGNDRGPLLEAVEPLQPRHSAHSMWDMAGTPNMPGPAAAAAEAGTSSAPESEERGARQVPDLEKALVGAVQRLETAATASAGPSSVAEAGPGGGGGRMGAGAGRGNAAVSQQQQQQQPPPADTLARVFEWLGSAFCGMPPGCSLAQHHHQQQQHAGVEEVPAAAAVATTTTTGWKDSGVQQDVQWAHQQGQDGLQGIGVADLWLCRWDDALLVPEQLFTLLCEARALVDCGSCPWAAVGSWGSDTSPVSWLGGAEGSGPCRTAQGGGENDYVVVLLPGGAYAVFVASGEGDGFERVW